MKKIIYAIALLLLACPMFAQDFKMKWERVHMDGSRTGATAPDADNVRQALGEVRDGVYYAPNGKVFKEGSVVKAAELLIAAQPQMAYVKEVIGYSPREVDSSTRPQNEIANLIVDRIMAKTAEITGKKVDAGIANFGGIRVDLPQGNVLLDDILSMLPFENYLSYVQLKGSDLRALYKQFSEGRMQVVGGVEMTIKDHQLVDIKVGGEPLDDNKLYGLATIDFLLDGGDDVFCARNAQDLIITKTLVRDAVLPYMRELTAAGKNIEYHLDNRVVEL
jgi:2',3'-cyclic-nucleotide 2'-phosphodiesterase (5'-nucleotidase family)